MAENSSNISRTFSLPLRNLPVNVNINTQGQLPQELEQVLRQISVERRTTSTNSNQPGHTRHARGPSATLSHSSLPAETAIIDMGDETDDTEGVPVDMGDEHGHQHGPAEDGQRPNWMALWKLAEKSLVFLLIFMAKLLYNHRLGILVFVGLFGTYYHSNTTLTNLISSRENRKYGKTLLILLWIVVFLAANIFFIYYVFQEQALYNSLIFMQPNVATIDFWNLLWVVGITDYAVRYATISLKAIVTMMPKYCIKFKRRGKYYMMLEELSQMYRCLLPVLPWTIFLTDTTNGGPWFSAFLMILYTVCKANVAFLRFRELHKAWIKFRIDGAYGSCPSSEEVKAAGESCAICQDGYHDPIKLSCKHIFCEDCVSMWFDREKTCPMCRADIVDRPQWRDGSTDAYPVPF